MQVKVGDHVIFQAWEGAEVKIGDEILTLKQGESVHFNGNRPHGIRNVGTNISESVWAAMSLGV
jgi:quercetin dioxygenase-like cupin family protein